jgi:hypothetical protein
MPRLDLVLLERDVLVDAELWQPARGALGFTTVVYAADTGERLDWKLTRQELTVIARAAAEATRRGAE